LDRVKFHVAGKVGLDDQGPAIGLGDRSGQAVTILERALIGKSTTDDCQKHRYDFPTLTS